MDSCCPKDSLSCLKTEPQNLKGETTTINDIRIYHNGSGPKAILVIYDIFGFDFGWERQTCDYLSSQGYQVFLPDFYQGKPYPNKPLGPDLPGFIKKHDYLSSLKAQLKNVIWPFINSKGVTSLGIAGFCWGAWAAFHIANDPDFNSIVKCVVSPHPSIKVEGVHGRSTDELVKLFKHPILLMPTVNELDRVKPNGEYIKMLCGNLGEDISGSDITQVDSKDVDYKKKVLVAYFENMSHGYASRGDLEDPEVVKAIERTHSLIVGFMNAHL